MLQAIDETYRRRDIQAEYNTKHGITPQGIHKNIRDITERINKTTSNPTIQQVHQDLPNDDILRVVKDLEHQMKQASKSLEFEKAALLRDEIKELRKVLASGKELHNDIRLVNRDL
jgi:excinuclease ABC subunit B